MLKSAKMPSIISRPAKNGLKRRSLSKGTEQAGTGEFSAEGWGLAAGPSPGTPTPAPHRLPLKGCFPCPCVAACGTVMRRMKCDGRAVFNSHSLPYQEFGREGRG